MDRKTAKAVISVIRTERQDRSDRLKNGDPGFAYDQWLFTDEPFINDMCLMVLVALRHQVERELVLLGAQANVGSTITRKQHQQNVANQREELKKKNGWESLVAKLNLKSFPEWETSMETLRLLANCLKHAPAQEPDQDLLKHLHLPSKPKPEAGIILVYAPISESSCFREGLAESVNLPKDADYCTIAETFVDSAYQFLENVRQKTSLAQVTVALHSSSSLPERGANKETTE